MWLRRNTTIFHTLGVLQWVCLCIVAALTAADKLNPEGYPQWIRHALGLVKFVPSWLTLALIGMTAASKYGRTVIGDPKIWRVIQNLLDEYRDLVFERCDDRRLHHYRITLFEYRRIRICCRWKKGRMPWDGWLCAVARSGHTTKKVGVFLAPLNKPDEAEGVVGQIFVGDELGINLTSLPSITKDSSPEEISDYARRAFVSPAWVQSRLEFGLSIPRTLCGYPILRGGERWGVIVFDSVDEGCISIRSQKWMVSKTMMTSVLSNLLKGI